MRLLLFGWPFVSLGPLNALIENVDKYTDDLPLECVNFFAFGSIVDTLGGGSRG